MKIKTKLDHYWKVIKRQTSRTASDYEWLQDTTSDYEPDYEPDYEWLQVTTSDYEPDYEWLQVTTSRQVTTGQAMVKMQQLIVKRIFTS